jgi:hypothetical protein
MDVLFVIAHAWTLLLAANGCQVTSHAHRHRHRNRVPEAAAERLS